MSSTQKLEKYVLDKTLGVGAFGKVKKARHEITNMDVAIKIINKKRIKNTNMNQKIKREIRLLRYFNSPNIIKLYEILDTTTDIFVVMEYVSGGELFDLISSRGRIPEDEAKGLFKQIIEGVEYFHNNLVTHRDLKPENILIDENNVVKIADFGLSNLMKDGKFLRTSCGSPNYAAPELLDKKPYAGIEVDTWSCGVILYALLAGYLPFDEEIMGKLYKKIKEGEYTIPSHFSPKAKDLIKRTFQTDPMKRIKLSDIKLHPWMRDVFPLTINIFGGQTKIEKQKGQIDMNVFKKLMALPEVNFHGFSEDKIIDAIKRKKEYSFVIAYNMLIDSEKKRRQSEDSDSLMSEENLFSDLSKILNESMPDPYYFVNKSSFENLDKCTNRWGFGMIFNLESRPLIGNILKVLNILSTTLLKKSEDYKLKCNYKRMVNASLEREADNDIGIYKENSFQTGFEELKISLNDKYPLKRKVSSDDERSARPKYSKIDITFHLSVYQLPGTRSHLVDIQLSKGHVIVFMEYSKKFFGVLRECIEVRSIMF